MPSPRTALALVLALPAFLSAQQPGAFAGQWVGGLIEGEDFAALAVTIADGPTLTVTFPNQRRVQAAGRVTVSGTGIRWQHSHDGEQWQGTLHDGEITGHRIADGDTVPFRLRRLPVIDPARLWAHTGTYRFPDGAGLRVEMMQRPSDLLLRYFDAARGEERWLFPENDSTFIAGGIFESPWPVMRRVTFTRGGVRWQRGDSAPVVAPRADWQPDTLAIARLVEERLRARDIPSVVVGIVGPEGLRWGRAWGMADRGAERPARLDTPYQVGSITKLFTAATILALRDRGKLRLTDDAEQYVPPEVRFPVAPPGGRLAITLEDLLTHTSGLPGNPINRVDVDGVMQPYSRAELFAGIPSTYPATPIGTQWSYSNLGFALLGEIASQAGGADFETLLHDLVLAPLGMEHSAIALDDATLARLAVHYWPEDSIRIARPRWVFGEVAGFGGLTSTVPDLARFVAMMLRAPHCGNEPIACGTLQEMLRPQGPRPGSQNAMGWGWWLRRDRQLGAMAFHGGEVDGHSSHLVISPVHELGVIVLANLGGSTAGDLGNQLFDMVVADARRQQQPGREQGFGFFLDGDDGSAAWALRGVGRAMPDDGVTWLRLGQSEFALDRFDAAREAFLRAAELDFFPGLAMLQLARLAARTGDGAMAAAWIERAWASGYRNATLLRSWPEMEAVLQLPTVATLLGSR